MGLFSYLRKKIIGEEGMKVLERYSQWHKELNEYSNKKVKLVSENRKLKLEGHYLMRYIKENNLLLSLDEKHIHTSPVGEQNLKYYGPNLPTEEYFSLSPFDFEINSLTKEQKRVISKFGVFELSDLDGGICVNRDEFEEIIIVLGGKKRKDIDEFEQGVSFGDFSLHYLITRYNANEKKLDKSLLLKDEKIQETYSKGIRYISIWSFKRLYGISPNTNETNYLNSEEIFYNYPSLETCKIKIDNRNFEYVLGYPEKILIEYFKI